MKQRTTFIKGKYLLVVGISALGFLFSCTKDDPLLCTDEFRTVGIQVVGKTLDGWYTIRESTQDTFRLGTKFQDTYAVLDDGFQPTLANSQEDFTFHGVIADSVWVKELFEISADECHISYVSGKLKVDL
jgi:hypothetical protein